MRSFTHASRWLLGPALLALTGCPRGQPGDGSTGAASSAGDPSGSTGVVTPTTGGPDTGAASSTGTDIPTGSTGDDSAGSSSTGALQTTGDDTTGTSTSTGEASTGSSSTSDATTGPPPRLFDCFGCDCDADTTFCRKVFAGVMPARDPPLCPVVDADSLASGCVVYPRDCADPPSCACLPLMDNNCFCNESERVPGAFEVTCPLP